MTYNVLMGTLNPTHSLALKSNNNNITLFIITFTFTFTIIIISERVLLKCR